MANELTIVNLDGVECYEQDGVVFLNLEACAKGLGIVKIDYKNGNRYERIHKPNLQKWLYKFGLAKSENEELPEFIPENVFYRLAMKAKNEAAERFQAKVADEIIPSIRKRGAYLTPQAMNDFLTNPETLVVIVQNWNKERQLRLQAQEATAALTAKIEEDEPFTTLGRQIGLTTATITVEAFAKILSNGGIKIGRNRLFQWLRQNGYIQQSGTLPYQRCVDAGLFKVKEYTTKDSYGRPMVCHQTLITGKGQMVLAKKLGAMVA